MSEGDPEDVPEVKDPSSEDFLYHLHRGTELLRSERIEEAKSELEQALGHQPEDPQGQDLLAGVYFRLGVYDRAIDLWTGLIEQHGQEATLRVNVALALLKTGQPQAALEHLHVGLNLDPEHRRGWGYLGLVYWRLGRYADAREAFLRGGQRSMAERMDGLLPALLDQEGAEAAELAQLAEEAMRRFEAESVETESFGERVLGARWSVAELGVDAADTLRPPALLEGGGSTILTSALGAWGEGGSDAFRVDDEGRLVVDVGGRVCFRPRGLVASQGSTRGKPLQRQTRGRTLSGLVGASDPVFEWSGPLRAVLQCPDERRFVLVGLADEPMFIRERYLWAFSGELAAESGEVAVGGLTLDLAQLQGRGQVVLALGRSPASVEVTEGDPLRVQPEGLIGWVGRLLPRPHEGATEPYLAVAPPLVLRGRGVVLLR